MQTPPQLHELLTRACDTTDPRARDEAFSEVMDLLLIFVRAAMGRALRNRRESGDVCQSIARSLVEDVDSGRVRFEGRGELSAYLQRVVASKMAMIARADGAEKRGGGVRVMGLGANSGDSTEHDLPGSGPTPSQELVADETAARADADLSEEEREIVLLRGRGLSWEEIARHTGRAEATLRQQWSRLGTRVEGASGTGTD